MKFLYLLLLSLYSLFSFSEELPEIIMIHGFSARPEMHMAQLSPVTREYQSAGFKVHIAQTPQIDTIESHANAVLNQILEDVSPGRTFMIDGHSQGGLVARLVAQKFSQLSPEEMAGRELLAVKTIGTPHRGSMTPRQARLNFVNRGIIEKVKNILPESVYHVLNVSNEMSPQELSEFNARVPNVDGVHYASITNINSHTQLIAPITGDTSDGLIPTKSSEWGTKIKINGIHPEGDHLSQVYNFTGSERAATNNGLALVEYSKLVAQGNAPTGDTFNFSPPRGQRYPPTKSFIENQRLLNCLLN